MITVESVKASSVTVLWAGHVSYFLLRIKAQDYMEGITIAAGLVRLFSSCNIVIQQFFKSIFPI